MISDWPEESPISFDDNHVVNHDRELAPGWAQPIAAQRDHERQDDKPKAAAAPRFYGWWQCGQVALPSRRFF